MSSKVPIIYPVGSYDHLIRSYWIQMLEEKPYDIELMKSLEKYYKKCEYDTYLLAKEYSFCHWRRYKGI